MASFSCLLPLLYAMRLAALPAQPGEEAARLVRASAGLPIIYAVGGKAIEVPIGTGRIAWKPEPLRDLTVALLEPPRAGDDIVGEDITEEDLAPIPMKFRAYALKPECFDLCIYGDITAEQRMVWLLAALSSKVMAARERGLSAAEEEKLILAGRGDIKRFFDRVEAQRPGFEEARRNLTEGRAFLRSLQPISIEFRLGVHGFNSLFARTLRKIETERSRAEAS